MKKTLSFISAIALIACAFVSCEDKESSGSSAKDKESKSEKSIVGTWVPSGDTLEEMKEDDLNGVMKYEKAELVITETEISMNASMDASSLFCVTDDGFNLDGESFDREYDGKVITITADGQTLAKFDRVDDPDENNIYGKYTNEEMASSAPNEEMYFDFVSSGVSYMVVSHKEKYTYDEKTGKVITTNASGDTEEAEYKVDGDNLSIVDEYGNVTETFTRAD